MIRQRGTSAGARYAAVGATLWFGTGAAFRAGELFARAGQVTAGQFAVAVAGAGFLDLGVLAVAVGLTSTYRIAGRRWGRSLSVHVAAAGLLAAATALVDAATGRWIGAHVGHASAAGVGVRLVYYALLAAAAHGIVYLRRAARTQAAAPRLQRTLGQITQRRLRAELRALKAELSPQFLARVLRPAADLMPIDAGAARRTVIALGTLMREAVARGEAATVTLETELAALAAFEEVARANDPTFSVTLDVDPEVLDAHVPHFAVAAVIGDVADSARGRGVPAQSLVRVRVLDLPRPVLEIRVSTPARGPYHWGGWGGGHAPSRVMDTAHTPAGCHAPAPGRAADGDGIRNLRQRLRRLYGGTATLIDARVDTGCVVLRVPAVWDEPEVVGDRPRAGEPGADATPATSRANRWSRVTAPTPAASHRAFGLGAVRTPSGQRRTASSVLPRVGRALVPWTGIWAGLVAFRAFINYAYLGRGGAPPFTPIGLRAAVLTLVIWLALRTTRRAPITRSVPGSTVMDAVRLHGRSAVAAALAAGLAAVVLQNGAVAAAPTQFGSKSLADVVLRCLDAAVGYAVSAAVAHTVLVARYRRGRAAHWRRIRSAVAEAARDTSAAELRALKTEFNPHFIGNALHAAAALSTRDPQGAGQVLASLGRLAERASAKRGVQEVVLASELAELDAFLTIERARLGAAGGVLTVNFDVAPELIGAWVPHLVLQPLVENAVRHGLAPRGGAGVITIRARRADIPMFGAGASLLDDPPWPASSVLRADHAARPVLEITVEDNGVGVATSPDRREPVESTGLGLGAGLGGVRRRLAQLYGANSSLALVSLEAGGTAARIRIPFRSGTPHRRRNSPPSRSGPASSTAASARGVPGAGPFIVSAFRTRAPG